MTEISSCSRSLSFKGKWFALKGSLACIAALTLAGQANAQEIYAFKDDGQLTGAMLELAARSNKTAALPKPCRLHIVTVAGGGELFAKNTFEAMNQALAQGLGKSGRCELRTHELSRDKADALFAEVKSQGESVLMLDVTYIPLTSNVVAFTKLRDGTGRLIGESGRFDLPVTKSVTTVQTVATAAPVTTASTKVKTKLLTEVHFDPGSANVTYVGKQKISQAIEAIKKQKPREIRILGFTDSIGSEAANKTMAQARAANVAQLLKQHGIDVPLVVEGKGERGGPYNTPDNLSEPLNRCVGIIAVGGAD